MTLVDTSAWVEYLRATGSDVHRHVRHLLELDQVLHTTDVVMMEVLAGGRDEEHAMQLRRLLLRCEFVAVEGLGDFEQAATLYRRCRRAGTTVRAINDCLIAAVAIRRGLEVFQADKDFEAIARHSDLRLTSLPRVVSRQFGTPAASTLRRGWSRRTCRRALRIRRSLAANKLAALAVAAGR